jgi:cysteinyl-tRNA synthetase
MKLYNTLNKKIEDFIPYDPNEVKLYTCGPTVYSYAHIGNLRSYIFADILEKSLQYSGYKVKRAMNITDVGHMSSDADEGEDKMLIGAKRENKTVWEIADHYTEVFFEDFNKLNIKKPEIVEKASNHIDEYLDIISYLLDKQIAYSSNGNIYFDVTKSKNYYDLSGKNPEDLMVGVREDVNADIYKKNAGDFGLWFTNSKFVNQAMQWDSPWGRGYPGWHIECSGLALKYLGDHLDIHTGGVDNVFPHHTNEIAQSEAYLGTKWCNYWMHCEHLNDASGKMSKSSGDVLTVSSLILDGYNPLSYRYLCLLSHYRKQLIFTYEALDNAQSAYNKLLNKIKSIKNDPSGLLDVEVYNKYFELFKEALSDDLNTANAITILHDLLKDEVSNHTKLKLIESVDKVLSLDLLKESTIDEDLRVYIENKIKERNLAKTNKDYALSDKIRDELKEKGIEIKDTRDGTTFEIIK